MVTVSAVTLNAITTRRSKPRIRKPGRRFLTPYPEIWKRREIVATTLYAADVPNSTLGTIASSDVVV